MFITLYTDASFSQLNQTAVIAWRGKCAIGSLEGSAVISSHDIHHAEMSAIRYAIAEANEKYPDLEGFFINADNLGCVRAFWSFNKKHSCPAPARAVFDEIGVIAKGKWIRAKHVKAHTSGKDVRSYMNRTVDRMTRR